VNRLHARFKAKQGRLLSIYLTAGYPTSADTVPLIQALDQAGVDVLEVGMPFSDPLADGTTIQHTSEQALAGGMTIPKYFEQVKAAREVSDIPMVFMGYLNQVYRMGAEAFCQACKDAGIDAVIVPDLPMEVYQAELADLFAEYGLPMCFLITPQTSEERIRKAAELSGGFLYVVADNSITGSQQGLSNAQHAYFERIQNMDLPGVKLIGFGISDQDSFDTACNYAQGAIVGSAFLRHVAQGTDAAHIRGFIQTLRPDNA